MKKQQTLFEIEESEDPDGESINPYLVNRNGAVIGQIAELHFEILSFVKGWEIARALQTTAPYDYLLKMDDKWKTVQVKSIHEHTRKYKNIWRHERRILLFRKSRKTPLKRRRYKTGDFDFLFATTGHDHWLIPYEEIDGATVVLVDQPRFKKYRVMKED
jgi:hypothetical protein